MRAEPLSELVAGVEHPHYPLTYGLLLVLFVSLRRFVLLFAVYCPPLHGRPVPSYSLLFDGNPRRCVFDLSALEGEEQKAQGRGDSKAK
jgi:hypothetical protein